MSELSREELESLVKVAVAEALKPAETPELPFHDIAEHLTNCPECSKFLDTFIQTKIKQPLSEIKIPTAQDILAECKDGICSIIDEHLKSKYGLEEKREEETGGLFRP